MSLFQNLFSSSQASKDRVGSETGPVKMDLDERMAFRREMLFDSLRTTLEKRGIPSPSYRFKVVKADRRGHSFLVMVDLPLELMDSEQGSQRALMGIASQIAKDALGRYGLGVAAVYWRVNEELKMVGSTPASVPLTTAEGTADQVRRSNLHKYERATEQELAAFEAAWKKGSELQIGDRTYASDLAPLGDDSKDSN